MLSYTEENYLKALLKLTLENELSEAGTNELAVLLAVKPATVNDMLKKLKDKELVNYAKYGKITLTASGRVSALAVLRKHRLWETFLFEKLSFSWHEVHEVAEQLEHIQSEKLVSQLDEFLGFPKFDPHGEPIPDYKGNVEQFSSQSLSDASVGSICKMVAVKDNSGDFLQYVDQVGLSINCSFQVISRQQYDDLMVIEVNGIQSVVSRKFAENILVI